MLGLQVSIVKGITFLCDSERYHLKTLLTEYLLQSLPVLKLIVGLQGFSHTGNHLFLNVAITAKCYIERQIVVRLIGLVDDFKVEGFCHNDATVILACVQCVVEYGGWEGPEDVASAEVNPCRFVVCFLAYCLNVKLWELVAFAFPLCGVELSALYVL